MLRALRSILLAMFLLSGCLPLPIAIQPYSSPITDGLALGEAEIRESSGINAEDAQAIVDEVLEHGFIPLLYSGNEQSKDKLKFHIGETMHPPGDTPGSFHARIDSIVGDSVAISMLLPDSRPEQDQPSGPGRLQCRAGFSNTRWNAGRNSSWQWNAASWSDQSRLIMLDCEISGNDNGQGWSLTASQPALRLSFHNWHWGYGWFAGESPLGAFRPAY